MRTLIVIDAGSISNVIHMSACLCQALCGETTLLAVIRHESERKRAEVLLAHAVDLLGPMQPPPQTCIRIGNMAVEIAREAEGGKYNLVIIGERHHLQSTIPLLRTDIERVADQSSIPVLFARGKARPCVRALLCEAGRQPPVLNRLIDHLEPLLQKLSEITILHVMSQIAAAPRVPGWELEADAEALIEKHTREGQLLDQDLQTLKQSGVKLRAKVRHGRVVEEILAETRSGDYDLVVIGAHKVAGWDRFLLDDLAHEIITHADRPVLIV